MNGRRRRSLTALLTALATAVSYAAVSIPVQPAQAVDAQTTAVIGLYDELEGFVAGLGSVGDLGQPLDTLSVSPGGPSGLDLATLLTDARAGVLGGATFNGAATLDDLADEIDGASGMAGDRDFDFTASRDNTGDVESLTIGVTASDTVTSSLDIADSDPEWAAGAMSAIRYHREGMENIHRAEQTAAALAEVESRLEKAPELGLSAEEIRRLRARQSALGLTRRRSSGRSSRRISTSA